MSESATVQEVVPAATGKAFVVSAGQRVSIEQLAGGQVADLFVFGFPEADEYLSAHHTRIGCSRLFPRPGEPFLSNLRRPIVTLVEDTSPGVHDMLIAACDTKRYELLGVDGHASCEENLRKALGDIGVEMRVVPQPVNLFMRVPIGADGELGLEPSPAAPGDRVALRAERDVIVVVSSCPQDLLAINNGAPKDLGVTVED